MELNITSEVKAEVEQVPVWIGSLEVADIKDEVGYDRLVEYTRQIKQKIKDFTARRKEITDPLDVSKKAAMDFFRKPIEELEGLEMSCKRLIIKYTNELEAKRLEAQRVANEAAEKERQKILKQAERQEAKGNTDGADMKRQVAQTIVAPVVQTHSTTKGKGVSITVRYSVEITDAKAFILWAVQNNRLEYFTINESLLNREACATKGARSWPGVKINSVQSTGVRI